MRYRWNRLTPVTRFLALGIVPLTLQGCVRVATVQVHNELPFAVNVWREDAPGNHYHYHRLLGSVAAHADTTLPKKVDLGDRSYRLVIRNKDGKRVGEIYETRESLGRILDDHGNIWPIVAKRTIANG